MSSTYADLRRTEAELDEQRRAALPQSHTPRNYAPLKEPSSDGPPLEGERAREPIPPDSPPTPLNAPAMALAVRPEAEIPAWKIRKETDERDLAARKVSRITLFGGLSIAEFDALPASPSCLL